MLARSKRGFIHHLVRAPIENASFPLNAGRARAVAAIKELVQGHTVDVVKTGMEESTIRTFANLES